MEDRNDVTVPMPGALLEQIDSELEYGDSRSEWIRDACRRKLEGDDPTTNGADAAADA